MSDERFASKGSAIANKLHAVFLAMIKGRFDYSYLALGKSLTLFSVMGGLLTAPSFVRESSHVQMFVVDRSRSSNFLR